MSHDNRKVEMAASKEASAQKARRQGRKRRFSSAGREKLRKNSGVGDGDGGGGNLEREGGGGGDVGDYSGEGGGDHQKLDPFSAAPGDETGLESRAYMKIGQMEGGRL